MIRAADAIEDLMCAVGKGETLEDRKLWVACRWVWLLLQSGLKNIDRHSKISCKGDSDG